MEAAGLTALPGTLFAESLCRTQTRALQGPQVSMSGASQLQLSCEAGVPGPPRFSPLEPLHQLSSFSKRALQF
jgi:hypothetical protein